MSENGKLSDFLDNPNTLRFSRFVFPLILSIITAFGAYVLNDLKGSISEIKVTNEERGKNMWNALQALDTSERQTHDAVIKTDDRAAALNDTLGNINTSLRDHEGRIRVLESSTRSR